MRFIRRLLLAVALLWANAASADVAIDASMTAGNSADGLNQQISAATSISSTGITVTSAATLLTAKASFASGSIIRPTAITATWGGVSMTQQVYATDPAGATTPQATSVIFTLVNPASGTGPLVMSWTTAQDCYMSATSYKGSDTTTGVNTADNISATHTTSLTVTSTTDGATEANFAVNGGTPTLNFTKIWAESPLNPGGGGSYNLGGTSNAHTFTGAGGTVQAIVGVHVIAPAGGAAPPSQLPTMGCCGKAAFMIGNPAAVGGYSRYGFDFSLVPDLNVLVTYPACDAAAGCKAGVRICQVGMEEVSPPVVSAGDTQILLVSTRTRCTDFFASEGSAEIYLLRKDGAAAAQTFKVGTAQYSAASVFGVIP